ncbi:MAG: hypothetical protein WAZ21_00420 [Candidatus Saccharimonadales bacterium]
MKDFSNKRILITQNDIYSINGSAVIVLELAHFLKNANAEVTVYTYFKHDPLKSIFEEHGIFVTDSDDMLLLDDFDYIWVHQQVLPLSIIRGLERIHEKNKPPVFIFNHMSSLDYIADEFPYIWDLENNLASLSLFNSPETKEAQEGLLSNDILKMLYQNPAPKYFSELKRSNTHEIKKILVISNHPPQEIVDLKEKFIKSDIELVLLGENQDKYRLIDLDLIGEYDLVISIGKTVQNCLVANIPVYVYDHFGGPGYLDNFNINLAENKNFSGRGFEKKTSEEIYSDITDNYSAATEFMEANNEIFIEKFTIDNLIVDILKCAKKKTFPKLDSRYVTYLVYSHNYSREHRIAARQRMVYKHELDQARTDLSACYKENKDIKNSKSYKLGNKIAAPMRKIKKIGEYM